MFKWVKNNAGFSLLEATLAVVIISTGMLAGLSVLQSNVVASVSMERNTIATQLANEKMEVILADNKYRGYDYATNTVNYPAEELAGSFNGFTREVEIVEVNTDDLTTPAVGSGLNKVVVTVSWADNEDSQVQISTLIANADY
ncbi:MAG: hypothetical protein ACD_62C00431G0005 [uncultured bacterium]|nr:MAG: hypothetical protein ACD_62C00431G0005 [uncultured bacterium]HLD45458.1 hypothetical protein [bacterium]